MLLDLHSNGEGGAKSLDYVLHNICKGQLKNMYGKCWGHVKGNGTSKGYVRDNWTCKGEALKVSSTSQS